VVCERGEASSSIYSHGNVSLEEISLHAHMQPTSGDLQETPRVGPRRLAQLGVWAHPGCERTQVEPPHDCLSHGGLLMGLGRVYVGAWPRFKR
jgi:hypothetical protein